MKRDFELVRKILHDMEAAPPMQTFNAFSYDGYDRSVIHEHIELLIEAGLLSGVVHRNGFDGFPAITRLTWSGHDFLDAMKDETIWQKANESILRPVGGVAFEVLLEWLKWQMKLKLGMPTE